jgi:hypothetical protein
MPASAGREAATLWLLCVGQPHHLTLRARREDSRVGSKGDDSIDVVEFLDIWAGVC